MRTTLSAVVGLLLLASGMSLLAPEMRQSCAAADDDRAIPENYKLLYDQDFAKPDAIKDFVFSDASAWKLTTEEGRTALELVKQSDYKPPFRSPFNIALIGGKVFGDCIIEVDCLQTGKEYGHRDMVFVFGFQGASKYYYTHISTQADDHANQVFIVKDAPRIKISKESNSGNNWGLEVWHKVRIERTLADGRIKVYFDDLKRPIMIAEDKTFGAGWIGFGSFDDTGKIANIKVFGPGAESRQAPPFSKP